MPLLFFIVTQCLKNSLTLSDIAGVIQAIAAAIALIGLAFTIYYQRKALKDQRAILELERKAKRATYFPNVEIATTIIQPMENDGFGGTIPTLYGKYVVEITMTVNENTLSSLKISRKSNHNEIFKTMPIENSATKILKTGDSARYVFEYKLDEENSEIHQEAFIEITFFYSDLIGNNYSETIRHDADHHAHALGTRSEN